MIGIDKISLFTPNTYVDLIELAKTRKVDPDKFTIGIGQDKMAVPPITQDPYSMAVNAADSIVTSDEAKEIDMVIFATESSHDFSKSGAVIVQDLLNIQPFTRSFEIKQACFGATAGLLLAKDYIKAHPTSKVLVIGSDIARYGLNTPGEVTQGAGAVAFIVSSNPRIIALDDLSIPFAKDVYDFWRPSYSDTAFVDGKFSNETYLNFFQQTWNEFKKRSNHTLDDFDALCFHLPYTKMGLKALKTVIDEGSQTKQEQLLANFKASTLYTRQIGNLYTASLYLGILSLLDHAKLPAGSKLGFFSYGSGASSEFFTGTLVEGYEKYLLTTKTKQMLTNRHKLSIDEYEKIFNNQATPMTPKEDFYSEFDNAKFYLSEIKNHIRTYNTRP